MLHTKVIEKIKAHTIYYISFPKNGTVDNVEKYGTGRETTDDNTAHKRCQLHAG